MPKSISEGELHDVRKQQVSNLKFLDKFIKTMKELVEKLNAAWAVFAENAEKNLAGNKSN